MGSVREQELERMRSAQLEHMFDECRIERRTRGAYNAGQFKHASTTTVLYEGPCTFFLALFSNISSMRANPAIIEMALRTERLWMLFIPYDAGSSFDEGDVAVITKHRDEWAPREVVVALVQGGGYASRRLLACKEVE